MEDFASTPPHFHTALLRSFRSVLAAAGLSVFGAGGVERAADNVIAYPRQVLNSAPADHHYRVLLEVMADSGNVGRHFHAVYQSDAGDLTQRGIRFLRRHRPHYQAHAALERISLQRRRRALLLDPLPSLTNQLVDRRQISTLRVRVLGVGC